LNESDFADWSTITLGGFAGKIPSILGATAREGTKTSGILCLLDIDSCGEPIWLSKRSNTLIILEM